MSRVAQILQQRGWSIGELCRRADVAYQTGWTAYHGTKPLSIESWVAIARALDVPLSEIAPHQAAKLEGVTI